MKTKFIFLIFQFFLIPRIIIGQQNRKDTLTIKEVYITDKQSIDLSGFKKQSISKVILADYNNSTLSEILANKSTIFIKNYSPGGLATSSFRGAGASHTQVLWNGITINSPMLGQVDFSEIPVNFIDNINLLHGGSGQINNSGALGGSIELTNLPNWRNRLNLQVGFEIGSFQNLNSYLKIAAGTSKFQSQTRISYLSDNYINSKIEVINNSKHNRKGILQEFYYRINPKQIASLKCWFQNSDNYLPSTINSNERSLQHGIKLVGDWIYTIENLKYTFRSSYSGDQFNYKNANAEINSINKYSSVINYTDLVYTFSKNIKASFGASWNFQEVKTNNYSKLKTRNNFSYFTNYNILLAPQLVIYLAIKQEIVNSEKLPIIPSFGIEYQPFNNNNIAIKTNISKNYRLPSFNDLYWYPGGNENLKPENGYSGELGGTYGKTKNATKYYFELTHFQSIIDDWIQWIPLSSSISSAKNLKQIHSRGIEAVAKIDQTFADFKINTIINFAFTKSTNRKTYNNNNEILGKQLIYVPKYNLQISMQAQAKKYGLQLNSSYISENYIENTNSQYLPQFWVYNLKIDRNIKVYKNKSSISLKINNLFNKEYKSISGYVMPGINLLFSLHLKLQKNEI